MATSTPSSLLSLILADSDEQTPHDGVICGTGGYSWQYTSDVQNVGPGGYPSGTAWGVFNWNCGSQVAGITVSVQNFNGWVLTSAGWITVTNHIGWCDTTNPQTNAFLGSGCNLSGVWTMPNAAQAIHWASDHNSVSGALCSLTLYQARQSGNAYVMADAGFDWWSGSSNKGAIVGRYVRLTTAWQWIGASTCTAAQLTANVLPP